MRASIRVLIVDDDEMVRDALGDMLEQEGFDVVGRAPDGLEGVRMGVELVPDVVLMDMRMPVMNGIDAARALRDRRCDVAVIVLSAYDDDALRAAAREAGAAGYVAKGTDPALLCDTIRRIGSIATGVRR